MKSIFTILIFFAFGHTYASDMIDITSPWVNLTPPGIMSNAGYMEISNNSEKSIRLTKIESPQFGVSHLHETKMENGEIKMAPVHGLEILANSAVKLEPGGLHIMLMHRVDDVQLGDEIELNLSFSDGQVIKITAPVEQF